MSDKIEYSEQALKALDPQLTSDELNSLAAENADTFVFVAAHANTSEEMLYWLWQQNDPTLQEVITKRYEGSLRGTDLLKACSIPLPEDRFAPPAADRNDVGDDTVLDGDETVLDSDDTVLDTAGGDDGEQDEVAADDDGDHTVLDSSEGDPADSPQDVGGVYDDFTDTAGDQPLDYSALPTEQLATEEAQADEADEGEEPTVTVEDDPYAVDHTQPWSAYSGAQMDAYAAGAGGGVGGAPYGGAMGAAVQGSAGNDDPGAASDGEKTATTGEIPIVGAGGAGVAGAAGAAMPNAYLPQDHGPQMMPPQQWGPQPYPGPGYNQPPAAYPPPMQRQGGGKGGIIAVSVIAVVLAIAGVVLGVLYFTGDKGESAQSAQTEQPSKSKAPDDSTTEPKKPGSSHSGDSNKEGNNGAPKYPAPGNAWNDNKFVTPTGNIGCVLTGDSVSCSVKDRHFSNDSCSGKEVFSATLKDGAAYADCEYNYMADTSGAITLNYGETTTVGNFACSSAFEGTTCWNTVTGNSFFISRQDYHTGHK